MSEKPESSSENGATTETAQPAEAKPAGEAAEPKSVASAPSDPLADAKAEAQKNKEGWIRTAADFDNFRKRARREIEDSKKSGREELLKEFLPVFDNLERALVSAQRATDVKGVVDGLTMIMKQFDSTVARANIQKVPTKGHQFDPTMHEAIQQVESDETPGTVVAEVQAGYMQGDRLIRAAMVVVAQPRTAAAPPAGEAPKASAAGSGPSAIDDIEAASIPDTSPSKPEASGTSGASGESVKPVNEKSPQTGKSES